MPDRCNCATFGSAAHCKIHTQADFDAQSAPPEPDVAAVKALACLLSHLRELYRDPAMQLTWEQIEPRWREIYTDDARYILRHGYVAPDDHARQVEDARREGAEAALLAAERAVCALSERVRRRVLVDPETPDNGMLASSYVIEAVAEIAGVRERRVTDWQAAP